MWSTTSKFKIKQQLPFLGYQKDKYKKVCKFTLLGIVGKDTFYGYEWIATISIEGKLVVSKIF